MNELQLLYVENTISRRRGVLQQALTFCFYVRNLAYAKEVDVHWAGEDGSWQVLPAAYWTPSGDLGELWLARTWRQASPAAALPGNIEFVAAYRAGPPHQRTEYWCKPAGSLANARGHFTCQADAGLRLGEGIDLHHVNHHPRLQAGQKTLTVDVAVHTNRLPGSASPTSPAGESTAPALTAPPAPTEVFVEWSDDGWRTRHRIPCHATPDHWDKTAQSAARNPNHYGAELWTARLRIGDAYRIEYAVGCRTPAGERWDNNRGRNYLARRADLKVLTLNLHTYQEERQDFKFSQIARAINELDIDLVCLQEVGENWNHGGGDWNSNAAKIICERLDRKYHLYTDWSHLGFDRYREGLAILSRFPFRYTESRYLSDSRDVYSIHTRKALLGQVDVPYLGLINIFSAHLSWWEDGFRTQFDTLAAWANASHTPAVAATLLCGDFNIKGGSAGYAHIVQTGEYEDQFLKHTNPHLFGRVFTHLAPAAAGHHASPSTPPPRPPLSASLAAKLAADGRIDYIWAKHGSRLHPTAARRLFEPHDYGRVSDHEAFLLTFEPPT
jgi:maltose 6'-phosphate phosphatase